MLTILCLPSSGGARDGERGDGEVAIKVLELHHHGMAVASVPEAKAELDRMGVKYWTMTSLVGPELEQIFMDDPNGNMVELHQTAPTAYTPPAPMA
jgi:hypothetical protein